MGALSDSQLLTGIAILSVCICRSLHILRSRA